MGQRRDAAVAVAEFALAVERRASRQPASGTLVATIGQLEVPQGSINVVPGRCRFSLDVRASDDGSRDACVAELLNELSKVCERRGLQFRCEETMRAAAAPSSPSWQARWEGAVRALGLPVFHLPSGAGHDAMKMHELLPQAMLFVRGQNAGISHNPLESVTHHDADLAVRAFSNLLVQLAEESRAHLPARTADSQEGQP
jgi:N-carbamoyl-L-amino-acid hydrolase